MAALLLAVGLTCLSGILDWVVADRAAGDVSTALVGACARRGHAADPHRVTITADVAN
jgi:hypothetical protein